MCFFKGGKGRVNRSGLNVFGLRSGHPLLAKIDALFDAFTAEERPRSVAILLLILVLLLHLWAALALLKPKTQLVKVRPVTIEVSLLAAPAPEQKTQLAPPPVLPTVKPKPVKPLTPPVKPPPRKKTPVIHKQAESPKPVAVDAQPAPLPPVAEPNIEKIAPAAAKTVAPPDKAQPKAAPAAKENEHATCVSCPKIQYPVIAQRRGWEGSVMLKLQLSSDGRAENVTVLNSSGHDALDEAAIANAKASRFTASNAGVIRLATKEYHFKLDK